MLLRSLFRILCTISSLSISIWIYAVNNKKTLLTLCEKLKIPTDSLPSWMADRYISAVVFFLILLALAYICIVISRCKKSGPDIDADAISRIEPAGEEVILTYLGLFFYALSVSDKETLIISFILLAIGCFLTRRYSFNPLYLFFGYRYYNVTTGKKTILMISKDRIKFNDSIDFEGPIRLNEFTYLDIYKNDGTHTCEDKDA